MASARALVGRGDSVQAVEIDLAIGVVLEVGHPVDAGMDHVAGIRREPLGAGMKRAGAGFRLCGLWRLGQVDLTADQRAAGAEAPEICLDRDTASGDRVLDAFHRDRTCRVGRYGAEQHGVDGGALRLGEGLEVVEERRLGKRIGRVRHARGVVEPVSHGGLLVHGIDPVGRGDQRGALGRHEARFDQAAGLDQLGGDGDIDIAGRGIKPEQGLAVGVGRGRMASR